MQQKGKRQGRFPLSLLDLEHFILWALGEENSDFHLRTLGLQAGAPGFQTTSRLNYTTFLHLKLAGGRLGLLGLYNMSQILQLTHTHRETLER